MAGRAIFPLREAREKRPSGPSDSELLLRRTLRLWLWASKVMAITKSTAAPASRWQLNGDGATVWRVAADTQLPHSDFIEQGGLRVGQVVAYAIGADRALSISRHVVWPGLRVFPNDTHGSLIRGYGEDADPVLTVNGECQQRIVVESVVLDGTLTVHGRIGQDLAVTRCTFPSTTLRTVVDSWTLRNIGDEAFTISVGAVRLRGEVDGPYGANKIDVTCEAAEELVAPGQSICFAVQFSARLAEEPPERADPATEEEARRAFAAGLAQSLRLDTPEPELNQAFDFCKLRVAESINATRGGLMLAPGGLSFYAAVWCNDNVEYAGPFFPFLGDVSGNQASLDTYRLYRSFMKPSYGMIPSSIVAEGVDTWGGAGDRGDAAMYAYGCARFCMAFGDRAVAQELWPLVVWCLEYCRKQLTADGVVASNSDELEGRFPTGSANLSTSSLYYGGLRSAADLGRSLGREDDASEFDSLADTLAVAIENYFGANVDGFETYRYYDGNDVLRSWICLPLTMGIMTRGDATIAALFSPNLWCADGVATQSGDTTFWDRSTLYALRGVLQAGGTKRALSFLRSYTNRRLLGDHAPYPVEEGARGSQLASESGLYCRIFTEGLFGIQPTGLDRFRCTPRLPTEWPRMALRGIRAFSRTFDVVVELKGDSQLLTVIQDGNLVAECKLAEGETVEIRLPPAE